MKIFPHHPSRLQACLWMCEKEIASQFTKSIKTNVIKNDKGNSTMIQWYIYINGINSTVYNIANYGLFPSPSEHMITRAPTMTIASKHTDKRGYEATQAFRTIYTYLVDKSGLLLSDTTERFLNTALFPSAGETVSLWIPFCLHYMYVQHIISPTMGEHPIFAGGSYKGTKEPLTRYNPMDNNHLTAASGEVHKIDNIQDLEIINTTSTVLDKQQIAYSLLEFKEQRNISTNETIGIISATDNWIKETVEGKIFHVDMQIKSPTKKKRTPTPKKAKADFKMDDYIRKDSTFTPLSNVGSNLNRLQKSFTQHQHTLPTELSFLPGIITELCQDFQQVTNTLAVGTFPSIQSYLEAHPPTKRPNLQQQPNSSSSDDSSLDSSKHSSSHDIEPLERPTHQVGDNSEQTNKDDTTIPGTIIIPTETTKTTVLGTIKGYNQDIKQTDATTENIKTAFAITTPDDITPSEDTRKCYLILEVPQLAKIHKIWNNETGQFDEWMHHLVTYIRTIHDTWTCSLDTFDDTENKTIMALVQTQEFAAVISDHTKPNTTGKKRSPTGQPPPSKKPRATSPGTPTRTSGRFKTHPKLLP